MRNFGVVELLVVVLFGVLTIWPAARVCRRAGFSPLLGVLAVIPLLNILLLWFLALAPWPARPTQ